jgi:hypothetical protein
MRFRINLSNFDLKDKKHWEDKSWNAKRLRFALTMWLELPEGKRINEIKINGCLAFLDPKGEITWKPPAIHRGTFSYEHITVSEDLHEHITRVLRATDWGEKLKTNNMIERIKG